MKINKKFLSLLTLAACTVSLISAGQSVIAQTDDMTSVTEAFVTSQTDATQEMQSDETEEFTETTEASDITDVTEVTDATESTQITEMTEQSTVNTDITETIETTKTVAITDTVAAAVKATNQKIEIDLSEIESNPQLQWYYADDKEFYINGIKVFVNGTEVDTANLISFNTAPESTYDGKSFDYKVLLTVTYNGQTAKKVMDVKIGQRGDANCDNKVNVRDAAIISRDLAQLFASKKTTLTHEDGFGIFLGNVDENNYQIQSAYYGRIKLNVTDCYYISYYAAKSSISKNVTMYNTVFV